MNMFDGFVRDIYNNPINNKLGRFGAAIASTFSRSTPIENFLKPMHGLYFITISICIAIFRTDLAKSRSDES